MEFLIAAGVFFLIFCPLILSQLLPVYIRHYRTTGNVVNHDSKMTKFVYKVPLSATDAICLLKTSHSADALSCSLDPNRSVIKFSNRIGSREYRYEIQEFSGFSILRLEGRSCFFSQKSKVPFQLNPFMVSQLQAEIIPFSQYGF